MRKWGLCLGYAVGLSALALGGGVAAAAEAAPSTTADIPPSAGPPTSNKPYMPSSNTADMPRSDTADMPSSNTADMPSSANADRTATTPTTGEASSSTAEVLGKLHGSNQKEIEMGKLAQKHGQSKEVKAYGKELVKDHEAADKKVTALAKKEKIDLAGHTPSKSDNMEKVEPGASFDRDFGKAMVEDHRKDIADVNAAREATTDDQLKKLLTDITPTLQKHLDDAEKIAGQGTMK